MMGMARGIACTSVVISSSRLAGENPYRIRRAVGRGCRILMALAAQPRRCKGDGANHMHVRRAFTFVFADPQWARKLAVAMLLNVVPALLGMWSALRGAGLLTAPAAVESPLFTPVSNLALIPLNGFLLRITRNVVAGSDTPLPVWSDVRGILRDGAKLWALLALWSLPGIAARWIVGDSGGASGQRTLGPDTLVTLWELAIFFVQPAAVAWLATTGSLAAGLNIRAVLATVRRNLGGYVVVCLVITGTFFVAFALGAVLLWPVWQGTGRPLNRDALPAFIALSIGVAIFVFSPYLQFVSHHLYGQAFLRANWQPPSQSERPLPRRSEPITPDHASPRRRRRHGERHRGTSRAGGRRTS
jgi:hypothetical protein